MKEAGGSRAHRHAARGKAGAIQMTNHRIDQPQQGTVMLEKIIGSAETPGALSEG